MADETAPAETGVDLSGVAVEGEPTEDVTGVASEAEDAEPVEKVPYVFWEGPAYVRRGLTVEDFASMGVETDKDVWWERDNGWRVKRDRIPLSDEQLAWLLGRESQFKLREAAAD